MNSLAHYLTRLDTIKSILFYYTLLRLSRRSVRHLIARGLLPTLKAFYLAAINRAFKVLLYIPSINAKVQSQLLQAHRDLILKLAPEYDHLPALTSLPAHGLSPTDLTALLNEYATLPNTSWSTGRVSGAVYSGSTALSEIWKEAYGLFAVSNPLHADIFPGVRKMDAEIVKMCLSLFNADLGDGVTDPVGAGGTTTSGGTESILMACKAYRDWARETKGITEPEMIVPISAHAAFDKAAAYFKIKIHHIPVDKVSRKVDLKVVKRAINPNTIMLVGSAPNFPDGAIDDITTLSTLAKKYNLGLHVDCCLGSFIIPFLERAGFPCDPFDFRVPGVTSISCDTHKYGFAPKGSSVIMYRSKSLRKYQYSVTTTWPGGVYASPSMAGSRPGAILAGTFASLMHLGIDGYTASCLEIVGAAKKIAKRVKEDFEGELYVLGDPLVSVVAFGSVSERDGVSGGDAVGIYEVGDRMGKMGWHLNALQNPPALHIACTKLTVPIVDELLRDLRIAVDAAKAGEGSGGGSMVMIYGLGSGSAVGPGLVAEMSVRYMDTLYA